MRILSNFFKPEIKKLSGITVVGKIDLPPEEKKKVAPYQPEKVDSESDFRRKKRRKRKPLHPLPSLNLLQRRIG
jgi:hypothetical protein